jgi:transposase-like protein
MTVRDIQAHLEKNYSIEVSPDLVSRVTDAVMDEVREWQTRQLDTSYPIVYLDALRVHGRTEGKTCNKALYTALGVNFQGKKEVLGFWIADNEGAKFWMNVLSELKNRGVEDILIACTEGRTGFPDAIRAVYPETRIQLCIVHMIRTSTKYVSYKDLKSICADLKAIYTAATEKTGREALEEFGTTRNSRYPMIYRSWLTDREDLNEFFNYSPEIRRAIYTTNAIESLNFQLRKVTKNRSSL